MKDIEQIREMRKNLSNTKNLLKQELLTENNLLFRANFEGSIAILNAQIQVIDRILE